MGQHYVSQHYLRQFRVGTSALIAIAQVDPFRWIGPGAIKGQCQEVDFYGKDSAVDKALTEIESGVAPALLKVAESLTWTDEELKSIRMLAVELNLRTRKAIESQKVYPRTVADEFLKAAIDKGELPSPPGGWRPGLIDFDGIPSGLLVTVVICFLEASTLRLKLLVAPKGTSFITSDHPVVTMNQFAAKLKSLRTFAGFSKAGFQLLLPLSPSVTAIMYDPGVYRIGARAARSVAVTSADVDTLNSLQVQSAEVCVYAHDSAMAQYVERICTNYASLRSNANDSVTRYPTNDPNKQIVHFQNPVVRVPRPLSFISYIKHVKAKPGDRRDPIISQFISDLADDYEKNPDGGDIEQRLAKIYTAHGLNE